MAEVMKIDSVETVDDAASFLGIYPLWRSVHTSSALDLSASFFFEEQQRRECLRPVVPRQFGGVLHRSRVHNMELG